MLEQIADAAGTDSDEHLNEFRAGDREKRNASFTGDGFGKQGLTGAGRTHQKHTLGNLGANCREAIRVFEEVNDLRQLELGPFNASDVGEGDLGGGLHLNPGLALAELHGRIATATALGPAEEEEQTTEQQQREDQASSCLLPGRSLTSGLNGNVHIVLCQQTEEFLIGSQVDLGATTIVFNHLRSPPVGGDQHTADLVVLNRFNEVAVAHGPRFLLGVATTEESRSDHHDRQD